jgi:hypothetical protein
MECWIFKCPRCLLFLYLIFIAYRKDYSMNYWDGTDKVKAAFGGDPNCYKCGEPMVAEDDHGRYRCLGCGYGHDYIAGVPIHTPGIPQVTDVLPEDVKDLPDEVKKEIPPIHRLHLPPTDDEKEFIRNSFRMLDESLGDMKVESGYPTDDE